MILDATCKPTERKRSATVKWSGLTTGNNGDLIYVGGFNDKCVHVFGTFGGATVTIKGGNVDDATKTVTLKDFAATGITFTAPDINSVRDNVAYIQPVVTGGSGVDLTVVLFME